MWVINFNGLFLDFAALCKCRLLAFYKPFKCEECNKCFGVNWQLRIDPFHNNIQFEAKDVIPSAARNLHHIIMFHYTYKTISCVAECMLLRFQSTLNRGKWCYWKNFKRTDVIVKGISWLEKFDTKSKSIWYFVGNKSWVKKSGTSGVCHLQLIVFKTNNRNFLDNIRAVETEFVARRIKSALWKIVGIGETSWSVVLYSVLFKSNHKKCASQATRRKFICFPCLTFLIHVQG